MNKKVLKQVWNLCAAISEASEEIFRFTQVVERATESMSQLPALVAACKKKHGLTER